MSGCNCGCICFLQISRFCFPRPVVNIAYTLCIRQHWLVLKYCSEFTQSYGLQHRSQLEPRAGLQRLDGHLYQALAIQYKSRQDQGVKHPILINNLLLASCGRGPQVPCSLSDAPLFHCPACTMLSCSAQNRRPGGCVLSSMDGSSYCSCQQCRQHLAAWKMLPVDPRQPGSCHL